MKRIKDLPAIDRPREKLISKGAQALSELELLEVMIGSGSGTMTVEKLASKVQKVFAQTAGDATYDSLNAVKGLSSAKATQILAALELAKRQVIQADQPLLKTENYVHAIGGIAGKQQEYLVCLSLDGARRLIARRVVTVGVLDSVQVHPREVFSDVIADRAAAIIIGHNHPSGMVQPSNFDLGFNQQLAAAAQIMGIEFVDHIIVSKRGHFSFKEKGLLR